MKFYGIQTAKRFSLDFLTIPLNMLSPATDQNGPAHHCRFDIYSK